MPELRQPVSLESMATHCLVKFVMKSLDRIDLEGSLEDFRQGISVIKVNVRDRMPDLMWSNFIDKVLRELSSKRDVEQWSKSNQKFELLMDGEIVDRPCDFLDLRYMNPENMLRFRGIKKLHFPLLYNTGIIHRFLEYCHLRDLTTLILDKQCTNGHLRYIGKFCSKLEVVKIQDSIITDEGLRALTSCKNLRVVYITDCNEITHLGVNHLISVHEKIEKLAIGNWNDDDYEDGSVPCVFLSRLENPCSSLKWLCIKTPVVTQTHLGSMVKIFRNLSRLTMICEEVEDLTILQSLSNLTGIRIRFTGGSHPSTVDSTWRSLQDLLKLIGSSITTLEFSPRDEYYLEDRQGLNFIYEYCPNIECLKFDFAARDLIVPPFPKLETLSLRANNNYAEYRRRGITLQLEHFVTLVNVKRLELKHFNVDDLTVSRMMLNNTMFPNLKDLVTDKITGGVERINRFARKKNLDFELTMYTFRSCVSRREN